MLNSMTLVLQNEGIKNSRFNDLRMLSVVFFMKKKKRLEFVVQNN
jgi:hypothetical protein